MSLLFRSKRPPSSDASVSTLRQRAARDQIRREIASEGERPGTYDANDWSLAIVDIRAALEGVPNRRTGPEFDPVDGSLVEPARRPAPWFGTTKQDTSVHGGRIDTQLESKKGGRDGQ